MPDFVLAPDLGSEFDIGAIEANKVRLNVDQVRANSPNGATQVGTDVMSGTTTPTGSTDWIWRVQCVDTGAGNDLTVYVSNVPDGTTITHDNTPQVDVLRGRQRGRCSPHHPRRELGDHTARAD